MEEDIEILREYIENDNIIVKKELSNIINELERLQKEFEAVDHECSRLEKKEIELENKKCLHCGNNTPLYCETCYQELISKNGELQIEIEKLKKKHKIICGLNVELLENIEYFIPKQVIRNKIQEYEAQGYIEIAGALKELLGE